MNVTKAAAIYPIHTGNYQIHSGAKGAVQWKGDLEKITS